MRNLTLEKIDVKKTKISITLSFEFFDKYSNGEKQEAFIEMLALACTVGSNGNAVKQLALDKNDKDVLDFDFIKGQFDKYSSLAYETKESIHREKIDITKTKIFK